MASANDSEQKREAPRVHDGTDASEPSEWERCRKERDEYLAGWQRARADFANYKKDETARITQLVRFAQEGLVEELLLVLDSFDLAGASLGQESQEYKSFALIKSQLVGILKRHGLEEIPVAQGDRFDPSFHEATETVDHETLESGTVAAVVYKGYRYQDKVVRPAKVKIAQ